MVAAARERAGNDGRLPAAGAAVKFPRRPGADVLSESIPLFFIGRNRNAFWVAREAEGRCGGIFLFKHRALRFAARNGAPAGCATMFLSERFELDLENQGSRLVACVDALLRMTRAHLQNRAFSDVRGKPQSART